MSEKNTHSYGQPLIYENALNIGQHDGELVDINGFYVSKQLIAENYNAMLEALKDISDQFEHYVNSDDGELPDIYKVERAIEQAEGAQ